MASAGAGGVASGGLPPVGSTGIASLGVSCVKGSSGLLIVANYPRGSLSEPQAFARNAPATVGAASEGALIHPAKSLHRGQRCRAASAIISSDCPYGYRAIRFAPVPCWKASSHLP